VLAKARIGLQPKSEQGYTDLAFAYYRLARDRGDQQLYREAEKSLQTALTLAPGNLAAKKLKASILLAEEQPQAALQLISDLQTHNHDDITLWGLLVDANLAINKVEEAERDAQWVLNLRGGSSIGFAKAARIREATGDLEGATEFYEEAARRTAQSDADERSWLLLQNARLRLKLGDTQRAEAIARQALGLFPDSELAKKFLAALPPTTAQAVAR
jgi:tetratricopeptide (TPR) repeat protein